MDWTLFQLLIIGIGILQPSASASIADWIWGDNEKNQENSINNKRQVREGINMPEVPFESMSNDERFLQEAQYFGLATSSQIDTCQQGVVLRLRSSCASLSEEQLAKFSVALLNCESAAGGRPQYPCNDEMSLRECTGDMDPDTWNTYHLMNNRARAVCLAARQAQFRALTEMTVNKLMTSAQGQLDAMSSLKDGQEKLNSLTEGTFRTVSDGHQNLLKQQETLQAAQRNSHLFVAHSLKELTREKAMVAAGHRELAKMSDSIRKKLDTADLELQAQNSERKEQHEQLLKDLRTLQTQASQIWQEIDRSTHEILSRHEVAVKQYEHTLESLRTINSTVTYLQNLLEVTRKEVDQRLGWISDTLGGAGGQLDLVIACLMHIGFLLMAMLTTAFLGAPACTRVLLLVLVSLNVIQLLRQGPDAAMSLPATTLVLALGTGLHQLIHALHRILSPPRVAGALSAPTTRVNGAATPVKDDSSSLYKRIQSKAKEIWDKIKNLAGQVRNQLPNTGPLVTSANDSDEEESSDENDSGLEEPIPRTQFSNVRLRRVNEDEDASRESTPSRFHGSRSGTPSRPATPRQHCGATCVNGQPCRLPATATGLCFRHSRQNSRTPL